MDIIEYEVVAQGFMTFLALCGVIVLLLNVATGFRNFRKPYEERLDQLREHEEKLLNDYEEIKDLKDEVRILLQGQMLITEHIVTGNHVDKLRKHYDDTQRYLIDK